MKTFISSDGGRWIRILQRTHLAFCPHVGWNLNQIFRFNRDWTGWEYEYVVNTWEWGNMVVKAEWGVSLLQWYQKTFSFSFDQAAALPSTQLVLDFRDWWSYKVWLKWPVLASSLAASLTLGRDSHTLLGESDRVGVTWEVKKVDEFLGEDAGKVVARVVARHTPAGLVVTFHADTASMQELHDTVTAVLAQAMESPDLCGEVPDHATLLKFLHDFLGQSPASLWADLLQEVSPSPAAGVWHRGRLTSPAGSFQGGNGDRRRRIVGGSMDGAGAGGAAAFPRRGGGGGGALRVD
ncbi:uncharacterized protein LOC135098884 isoform X5 [Scylla paramamosain]|uniref:uncharacterized protein LOC135098884 isoform X5 n=1 Tax=Scylla paramamosain TaxID=85552 RepID=UPI0030834572